MPEAKADRVRRKLQRLQRRTIYLEDARKAFEDWRYLHEKCFC